MTTRFSLAELADMLHVPVDFVRTAVDELAASGELTAESFVFNERNWRIAPSDVKRIQEFIHDGVQSGRLTVKPPERKVRRKLVQTEETE